MSIESITLNPKQSKLYTTIFDNNGKMRLDCPKEIAYFGAFRCGKSMIMMAIAYMFCTQYSKVNGLYARGTYPQLEDSVIKQFLALFPPSQYDYEYKDAKKRIVFANESVINFRSFDKADKILSNEYDFAVFCQAEEIAFNLFLMVIGRMSGKALPKPIILTEGNPSPSWVKERYVTNKPKEIMFIQGTTFENKDNLPDDYIEQLEKEYPADYIDRYLYGGWDQVSDGVYASLCEHHLIFPLKIEKYWHKCIGLDHGTVNDTSLVWMAKDENDNVFIYDEWHKSKCRIDEIVSNANRHGPMPIIADYSMKTPDRDYGSWWNDLQNQGLTLIEARKDKQANILLVNQLFHQNHLRIFNHLTYVIDQHKGYRYKPAEIGGQENRKEEVIKKDDHSVDAVQYAVRYLKDVKVKSPYEYLSPKQNPKDLSKHLGGNISW